MTFSCELCNKTVSTNHSDCNETWQEVIRAFTSIKGQVVCFTCIDEVFEQCFEQIKKGRKYIRYETVKKSAGFTVGNKFNREKRC